jgi:hypothetical protein
MPYKQTNMRCVVRLVGLRGLSPVQRSQCQALRQEAGRLWSDRVTLHTQARTRGRTQGRWLSASELAQATKGGHYALHSQRVQALCQQFAANVETATALRKQELAGNRNWRRVDTSRRPIRITPRPTRRWSGKIRR